MDNFYSEIEFFRYVFWKQLEGTVLFLMRLQKEECFPRVNRLLSMPDHRIGSPHDVQLMRGILRQGEANRHIRFVWGNGRFRHEQH